MTSRYRNYLSCVTGLMILASASPQSHAATSIPFTITMNEAVSVNTVGGTPHITINIGGVTRYASYTSGSGTSSLTFTYAAQAGDVDLDGITLSSPLDLNGGTISDLNGNPETDLTFTVPNTSGIKVDYPSMSMNFIADSDGQYTLNGTIYNDLSSFLTATGGTFTRTTSATYVDSFGTIQLATANQPRFDYDPITHTARGILIEESRTNLIAHSEATGAVAGSPGTFPSGWGWSQMTPGLTGEILGSGTENGLTYVDFRISGTNTGANRPLIRFGSFTTTTGAIYTTSFYFKCLSGSCPNFQAYAGGTNGWSLSGATPNTAPTTTLERYSFRGNAVTTGGSSNFPWIDILTSNTTGITYDFSFRIAAPQVEKGTFSTSYIPTGGSAVVRQPDNLLIPAGPWLDTNKGTFYAFFDGGKESTQGTYGRVISPSSSFTMLGCDGASTYKVGTWSGGGAFTQNSGQDYYTTAGSAAMSYNQTSLTRSVSTRGQAAASNSYTSPYSFVTLGIGRNSSAATNMLNGHIQNLKYYPESISDTQLQLLTQ